jgi:hypothetical protein
VLIIAAAERALAIAQAIADPGDMGKPGLLIFDGAAILDPTNQARLDAAGTDERGDLVIRDIHRLTRDEQTALMALLDSDPPSGSRRIIAASPGCLFDCVHDGSFMGEFHIVSDPGCEERPASPGPIIAE